MRQAPNKRNKIAFKISGNDRILYTLIPKLQTSLLIGQLRVPILTFKTRLENKKSVSYQWLRTLLSYSRFKTEAWVYLEMTYSS